ncbi:THO complex subunit 3 [Balamuthia mandrillaris]
MMSYHHPGMPSANLFAGAFPHAGFAAMGPPSRPFPPSHSMAMDGPSIPSLNPSSSSSSSSGAASASSGGPSSSASSSSVAEQKKNEFSKAQSLELKGHKKEVHSVAWNCTGRKLASGSVDNTTRVWNISHSATKDLELKGHTNSVHQLCWDPTHQEHLATASADCTVKIWDTRSGKCSHTIKTNAGNINITWCPDGSTIAVGNKVDLLTIIDTRKYDTKRTIKFHSEINEMAWSQDAKYFFLTTGRGDVDVLHWPSLERVYLLHAHTANCYCIKFSPKGDYFAVGSADSLVTVWDYAELACVRTIDRLSWPIRSVSFSYDSKYIASASEDLVIDVSSVETGETVHSIQTRAAINSIAWNPRKNLLAFAETDQDKHRPETFGNITLWGPQLAEKQSSSSSSSSSSASSSSQ